MGWSEDDVVVATVANLRTQKDYPNLVEAAALAIAEEPRLRFIAIGQGPLEGAVRADVERRSLGDRFDLLGFVAEPTTLLSGTDIFTLASRHEGLPIALLEAMAVGLPPVATAVGGIPEVIADDLSGRLVPPGDPSALAAQLVVLAQEEPLRQRLALGAQQRAADFDIGRTAQLVETAYEHLVARQHPVYHMVPG
jgi:glycosyltransferase involved in cell wall biosynthesis